MSTFLNCLSTLVVRSERRGGACRACSTSGGLTLRLFRIAGLVCTFAVPLCIEAQGPPTSTELIRGRVITDSGTAIVDASVIATRAPDFAVFQSTTDTDGRYVVSIPNGTGDYLLHVYAVGRQSFRKRVTRDASMSANDTVFTLNVTLAAMAQRLGSMRIQATRPKPSRIPDRGAETGAAETVPDNMLGVLPPDLAGNLTAIAGTLPGVTAIEGGYSVLGLGADHNQTTLNGLAYGGNIVPRDVALRTRVSTTTYDPARGGFSGALVSVDAQPGSLFSGLTAHATFDAPALQYTDPVSAQLGERFANFNGGVGGSGPLGYSDRFVYNYGVDASHRTASAASLLDAAPALLTDVGVAADSVRRFLDLVGRMHAPVTTAASRSSLVTDEASVLARFDRTPYDARTFAPLRRTGSVTFAGDFARSQAVDLGPTVTPAHAGDRWQGNAQIQGELSAYVGDDYLFETTSALSASYKQSQPFLELPDANVLVSSGFENGSSGLTKLSFGGNADLNANSRTWAWETLSQLQVYPARHASHHLKFSADARFDGYRSDVALNRFGTFSFASLTDLAAAQPSSFTRLVASPVQRGGEWSSYLALGDLWRVSPTFQLLYGARVEGNVFNAAPAYNPLVDQTFGYRTDAAPASINISPRLGFTWVRRGASNNGAVVSRQVGQFQSGPTAFVRGGVGEFRGTLPADLLSNASANTGLPGSSRQVACFGPTAPTPDWDAYVSSASNIPNECVGVVGGATLSDTARMVQLFDPTFQPPKSWRGNLSYTSQLGRLAYAIDGTYSLNLAQPGIADLNFGGVPVFVLPREGRAVFVPSSSIVPGTGAVSPVSSRTSADFSEVIDHRSDLRSVSRQLTLSLWPDLFIQTSWYARLDYTLANVRALSSGFDGSTFESPNTRQWTRAPLDLRHQLLLRAGYGSSAMAFTVFARVQSGLPFTPTVGSDVNGDGLANDRAFVFDPAKLTTPADSALATGTRALLASSSRIRHCLLPFLGKPVAANSCEGPWSAALNAQLTWFGGRFHLPRRINTLALTLTNPLGGLDQLLHGPDRLRGWGTQPQLDPTLYQVRGFDAATNSFEYDVNPRFGNANPAITALRSPFRVSIDVALNFGRDIFLQQLERSLKPGRRGYPGPRLGVAELKQRYSINIPDGYAALVADPDSILLSPAQTQALQQAEILWLEQRDTLLTSLATYLVGLGDAYDVAEALRVQEQTIARGWELARIDAQEVLPRVLSPAQLRMVPGVARTLIRLRPGERPGGRTILP